MNEETIRIFLMTIRKAFLLIVDAIERLFDIEPKTAELRKSKKDCLK